VVVAALACAGGCSWNSSWRLRALAVHRGVLGVEVGPGVAGGVVLVGFTGLESESESCQGGGDRCQWHGFELGRVFESLDRSAPEVQVAAGAEDVEHARIDGFGGVMLPGYGGLSPGS